MKRLFIPLIIAFTFGLGVATLAYQARPVDESASAEKSSVETAASQAELERLRAKNVMLQRDLEALRQAQESEQTLAAEVSITAQQEQAREQAEQQKKEEAEKKEEEKRDRGGNVWARLTPDERREIHMAWRNMRTESRMAALDTRLNLEDWERERVREVYETDWDEVDPEAKISLLAELGALPEDEKLRIDMMALDEEDQMRLIMMRRSIPQEKYEGYLSYLEDRDISERSSRAAEMLGRIASSVPLRSEQRAQVLEIYMNDEEQSGSWRRFHNMKSMEELDTYYEERLAKLAPILDEEQFAAYTEQVLLEKQAAATMMEIMLSKREE